MLKRILKTLPSVKFVEKFPGLTLGSLVIVILCSFLMVIATFTKFELVSINLVNVFDAMAGAQNLKIIDKFYYIPQVPVVMLIAGFLGPRLGLLSVFLYLSAGLLGFPVFALGGGPEYFTHITFGYVIAYLFGVTIAGRMIKKRSTSYQYTKATVCGVLSIHLIGIIYLILLMFFQGEQLFSMLSWIWLLSGMQVLYDLLFGYVAINVGKVLRTLLWIVLH
ncbi:MAG: biotin transporter BioY [Candidatus Gastranaerophilaceae bacterium]|jgi:biotin transport system substrate-specific component